MTPLLTPALLPKLGSELRIPNYDRTALTEGVVHLGLGAFHRAHQAIYFDDLARKGDLRWGVVGVSLRSPGVRDRLAPQDGLYTVESRDSVRHDMRVVGVLKRILVAPEDPEAVLSTMAQPSVRMITLTITEKGYGLDRAAGSLDRTNPDIAADLAGLAAPRSAVGFIVAALMRRHGTAVPPFAAVSCDNLPHNGRLLRDSVLAMARAHDAALADWIAAKVAFPATMVDRIVPAITSEKVERFAAEHGYRDEGVIETEGFCQWVIEDCGLEELRGLGTSMAKDVSLWEDAKLRLLNGAHSTIAYLGALAGIAYVHEFVADPVRRALIERLWNESETTLRPVPGLDFSTYRDDLLRRFANPMLQHRTHQIAMDGSQKLPQRLVAPLRARLEAGQSAPTLELAIAAWMAWQRGVDLAGNAVTVDDPMAARTAAIWAEAPSIEAACGSLLALPEIFGSLASDFPDVGADIAAQLCRLIEQGPAAAIARLAGKEIDP